MILLRGMPAAPALLALVATHLVISMPTPPVKRSPEVARDQGNGFSNVPKILEIQLPLKIATKDDLVAWAKYVMGLMASRINITLTTVKDNTQTPAEPVRTPSSYKQMQNYKTSGFKNLDPARQVGIMKAYAKTFESSRYAENAKNHERNKNPVEFKIQDTNRYPERNRIAVNVTPAPRKEVVSIPSLQAFSVGPLLAKNFLGIRPTAFATMGITDHTTVHSPLEISANINLPRPDVKESLIKGSFDVGNALKVNEQQFFVPTFPDFGPFSPKNIDAFNTEAVPPARTYLPVPTTTDNIRFPSDSFATRYFFDGIERNVTSNLGILPVDLRYTTIRPFSFSEEIPLPVKSLELATRKNSTSFPKPILNVPFEAVITFTREATIEPTTLRTDSEKQFAVPTREPLDAFPPYFDNNVTVMNESGQINVVFDDGSQVTEKMNGTRKGEKKSKKKKKKEEEESSKKKKKKDEEESSSQKTTKEKTKKPSMLTQIIKAFGELRKKNAAANNSLSVDLSPPPLKPPLSFPLPPRQESTPPPRPQSFPPKQQAYPQRPPQTYPPRPQQTYPERPPPYPPKPSESQRERRNLTSLAQELEDDDQDGNSSEEDKSEENKNSEEKSEEDEGSNPKDDAEENEESNSSESSSEEDDYSDEEEEGGGSVQALISLLQLAAPVLEDLSDPESDTDIGDVFDAAIPLLEDLSNGDGVNPGVDVAGILVPILLQISGGPEGMGDSVAILTPILQVLAPLVGPLSGPLLVPLSRQSSNAPGQGGSSSGNLITNLSGPLSETGPGKMPMIQSLIAGVVSSLSKNSGGGSDITSLVKAIVAGSVAGTSASSSGPRDSYGAPTSYGGDSYGYGGQPSRPMTPFQGENPIALLGSSVNDILNAILKIVASLINAIMGILGASSSSAAAPAPAAPPAYGAPSPYQAAPSRLTPPPRLTQNNSTRGTSSRGVRFFR